MFAYNNPGNSNEHKTRGLGEFLLRVKFYDCECSIKSSASTEDGTRKYNR